MSEPYFYRVHYSDSDAAGVVYHTRYLEVLERARFHFFEQHGLNEARIAAQGYIFAIVHIDVKYRASAGLWRELEVHTEVLSVRRSSMKIFQQIFERGTGKLFCEATVELVCVRGEKASRLPEAVKQQLDKLAPPVEH